MSADEQSRPPKTVPDRERTEVTDQSGQEKMASTGLTPSIPTSPHYATPTWSLAQPPFLVPDYTDWELLGFGTFGQVWRARHVSTTTPVAIKFLVSNAEEVEREVRRLGQLVHTPGIIHLEGVFRDGANPYLIMEYADHGSLSGKLDGGPLPLALALQFFREIAQALAYVHSKGILHCDLKPSNVLLDSLDHVRLADFGQAQLASELSPSLGTFFYMAPEQAQLHAQAPDTRWDVYALGAILYQMLTGKVPRYDEEFAKTLQKTASVSHRLNLYRERLPGRPRPVEHRSVRGVDGDLADIIDRCLDLDPEKRYSDASSVLGALQRREQRRKQRPIMLFGIIGPLLLLSLILLFSWLQSEDAIEGARKQLSGQRVAGNRDSARLVASAMQRNLRIRVQRVNKLASDRKFRRTVKEGKRQAMEEMLTSSLMATAGGGPSTLFASAWVTTPRGRIIAIRQIVEGEGGKVEWKPDIDIEKEIHHEHKQLTWRDWFTGKGNQPDRERDDYPMVTGLHVSDPYESVVKDRGVMIAVSMPIRDPENDSVMGLLCASVPFQTLSGWLSKVATLSDGGEILILNHLRDGRRVVLYDSSRTASGIPEEAAFPEVERVLGDEEAGDLIGHVKPDNGTIYLVGFARTTEPLGRAGRLDWVVLVQHQKEKAMAAIEQLRDRMWRFRLLTYGLTAALMAGLWAWLFWLLRRQDAL